MDAFYTAFDTFVGDIVATGSESEQIAKLMEILETDDAIVTQAATKADTESADYTMCPVLPACQLDADCKEPEANGGSTPPGTNPPPAVATTSTAAPGRSSLFGVALAAAVATLFTAARLH
eukprot:5792161-Pyramimonas_sp.AAC.1